MWPFSTSAVAANDRGSTTAPITTAPTSQTSTSPVPPASASSGPQTENVRAVEPRSDTRIPIFSQRSLKQLSIFFAGAGFLGLSMLITRRSVIRKQKATIPLFYQPSNRPVGKIGSDNALIAFEALNLATLNVLGFAIMAGGGLSWAFDISHIEDLRGMVRKSLGESGGKPDEEAEAEIEEWIAEMLSKKELREKAQAIKSSSHKDDQWITKILTLREKDKAALEAKQSSQDTK